MKAALLTLSGVTHAYESSGARSGVRAIDFQAFPGELVGLVGPNGAGKSTFLKLAAGLLTPQAGHIWYGATSGASLSSRGLARHRAFLPQEPPGSVDWLVEEGVALGRYAHLGRFSPMNASDLSAVEAAITRCGLTELRQRPMWALSGGEAQRVSLARCLAQQAPLLLLDEPSTHLDLQHQLELMDLLRELAREGHGVVVALHDLTLAARYADRVIVLAGGDIVAEGQPSTTLTVELLARVFRVEAEVRCMPDGGLAITPLAASR